MLSPPAVSTSRRLRIIVADDHEWIRNILVQVARQTLPSAEIISVEDGAQAFEAYSQGDCDFLITNHAMPHVNGATLIHKVRAETTDLPVLMVSVHPEAEAEAMAAGANWFLTKEQIMERMPGLLRQYAGRKVGSGAGDRL